MAGFPRRSMSATSYLRHASGPGPHTDAQAVLAGIPVVADEARSTAIARAGQMEDPVPESMFQRIANILVAAKLI